jgi:hypothetical protein
MKFQLHTLVDITCTGARRGDDHRLIKQQQNYLTVIQTIGIRANPEILKPPTFGPTNINRMGFGSAYRGVRMIWSLEFGFGLNQTHSLEQLLTDFDFVPVIGDLTENTRMEDWVFRTRDAKHRNIVFLAVY